MLEKTLESPLDNKAIKPIHWKGNAEAETPVLCLPDAKSQLIRTDPDSGKDWEQGEKGNAEYATVGWNLGFKRNEFEQTLKSWSAVVHRVAESDTTGDNKNNTS